MCGFGIARLRTRICVNVTVRQKIDPVRKRDVRGRSEVTAGGSKVGSHRGRVVRFARF